MSSVFVPVRSSLLGSPAASSRYRLALLLLVLTACGCATVRNVDVSTESSLRAALQEGDRVTITTRDEQQVQLTIVNVSDDGVRGEDPDGQPITIDYDDIAQLEIREPRPGRTAALVGGTVGGIALVYAIATAVAAAALLGGI